VSNRNSLILVSLIVFASALPLAYAGDKEGNGVSRTAELPGDKEGNGTARYSTLPSDRESAGGDREGNGGYAASCGANWNMLIPQDFVALELAEAQVRGFTPVPAETLMSLEAVVNKHILPILNLMSSKDRESIQKDLSQLIQAVNGADVRVTVPVKTLVSSRQAYVQYPLIQWVRNVRIKKDMGTILLNGSCKIFGAIAQYQDSEIGEMGSKYQIARHVWMNLGFVDQAALLFHEVLYKQILAKDPSQTSEIVRDIVSMAFTKEGAETSHAERSTLLRQAGF
jgi:hypothetical protein